MALRRIQRTLLILAMLFLMVATVQADQTHETAGIGTFQPIKTVNPSHPNGNTLRTQHPGPMVPTGIPLKTVVTYPPLDMSSTVSCAPTTGPTIVAITFVVAGVVWNHLL